MAELHPFFVHFPIALLMVASPFDVYGAIMHQKQHIQTAYVLQVLAGLFAVMAGVSGNLAETVVVNHTSLHEGVKITLEKHISLGNAMVWIIVLVVVGRTFAVLEKKAWAFRGWVFPVVSTTLAMLILMTGLLGGELSRDILEYFKLI